ncbi:hypothetical protein [Gemmiger formicilis]|uniref:hypothetical protein n=1 Tax=Gemmiger formicilis TaxID=745368 RepID=UPI003CCAB045
MSFFDGANPFVIDRPVRLIELFAGIGAQAKAVERLGIEHELYRVSEWDVFANCSYRAIHCKDDTTDYSAGMSLEDVTEALIKAGLSSDGKTPLTPEQIKAKPEKWRRGVYSNLKATRNIGSITRAAADDLAIVDTDKYICLVTYAPGNCKVINTKNGLILPGGCMTLKVYAQLLRPYKVEELRRKSLSASKRIRPAGIPILPSGGDLRSLISEQHDPARQNPARRPRLADAYNRERGNLRGQI